MPRRLLYLIASLLLILWVADGIIAIRVEKRIATIVENYSNLEVAPRVSAGGTPYTAALLSGTLPQVSADVYDVDLPPFGMVNARTEAINVEASPAQVLSGDLAGAQTELLRRTISLDGVSLGRQLGIMDLDIANPYDISPAGGSVTEAKLTGTPEKFERPISVVVALRLDGPMFRMTPRVIDFPEREEEIREAFTYEFDTRELPLASQAQSVTLDGGSIRFSAEVRNTALEFSKLAPLAK
ncbi:LmeA family phospholipid-binding protein [Corynebacterium spheniscorum]|uniref:DUF2993 domain-containing protein n=1 Tax=Corynebacterium spheniscorum TaxID=185761 RepID=A0A1I2UFG2_9CORY|nr:DUF2993 domain-containing protein [Corynebacterium spheniscorum]SFG73596.1 Protein of unknown function [Corynebacterium spheniscorum]